MARWADTDLPNMRRHRLPSFTLISFLFPVSLSFTALYRARVRPARHFSFCPYFSTPTLLFSFRFSFFSARNNDTSSPSGVFLRNTTRLGPGARSPEVRACYGSKLRRLYIPHSLLAGPAARAGEQGMPLFRARISHAAFSFLCVRGGIMY